ncbi:MAG TPA: DUF6529 family protein [Acidimicrobiales bacterium]|nr:DUF6529 family protein [Acidimicrobiales bacterium]
MDWIKFLNDVTGGHLLAWKVVAASVVFALAGLQVMLAARFWQVTAFPGVSPQLAVRVHRVNGRVAVIITVAVGLACLVGPAGPVSPTRVLLHSIFGTLLFVVLAGKYTLLKLTRAGRWVLPVAGITLFLTFGAIWATSVADYVTAR